MRILVTRPLEDAPAIADRLRAMGHEPVLAPLLVFQMVDGAAADFTGVQAILASSANGIRALVKCSARSSPFARSAQKGEVAEAIAAKPRGSEGRRGFDILSLPVFAVGPQTTQEARQSGFTNVRNADGDARALAQAAAQWARPEDGALLHVCGEEAPGTLGDDLMARGFDVRRAVLYRMAAATHLPHDVRAGFGALDAVLFFSPRTVKIFGDLARDLPLQKLVALCISPATAQAAAALGFASIRAAARPNQDSLLSLVV